MQSPSQYDSVFGWLFQDLVADRKIDDLQMHVYLSCGLLHSFLHKSTK